MAIDRRWINWATTASGGVLLLFSLAQLVMSFYMNLTAENEKIEKTNISGAMMVSLGVLLFPTAWVAFTAAISRHRGVYIAFVVMTSLSLIDAIGMVVYQAYRFSVVGAYVDIEKGIAITMVVLQSLLIVILVFCLAFGAAALCYRHPDHSMQKRFDKYGYQPGYSAPPPPMYNQYPMEGYRMSLPRGAWDYTTEPRSYYPKVRY